MPASRLQIARGLRTSLRLGRSDSRELKMGCWFRVGAEPRCVYPVLPSFRLERVSHVAPIARSGALTRSNNTFHSLFDLKCFQVPPRTPKDTPTLD
ncbi:hypothetical protein F2Q69_00060709 [Brassica cretica]|uniref:Uncharacterized protein n=1 Tax=Brassica cretica TaxID=69181 RepID=A0A8S9RIA8_BRACR|nr:hypothetical protein F2Q69_00060709 [Brassica cretica]